jgi:pantetheine-phosphate adenylyltransferase
MKRISIYPGSFDPPTLAHLSVLEQAEETFDEVIVVVAANGAKDRGLLLPGERVRAWKRTTDVRVEVADPLDTILDTCRKLRATSIVRGIRGPSDVESEQSFFDFIAGTVDVVYFTVPARYRTISSTKVRSIVGLRDWAYHISDLVPSGVADIILEARNS